MQIRTAEEFVEDMISDCKTKEQIMTVARSTRWKNSIEEITQILERFEK